MCHSRRWNSNLDNFSLGRVDEGGKVFVIVHLDVLDVLQLAADGLRFQHANTQYVYCSLWDRNDRQA